MRNLKRFLSTAILGLGLTSFNASSAFINFNDYTASGFANQAISGTATSSADGSTLTLEGNLWVSISELFNITADSTLYFTMEAAGVAAEWYGIGLEDDNSITASTIFQLGGTESTSANQISTYTYGDGAVDFVIDVGSSFTGVFDRLLFILDADNVSGASVSFSNVEICNDTVNCESLSSPSVSVSAPGALGLFTLSCIALAVRRKRFIA
ncbi:hypothetical protein [Alteromonas australica]|uniref:PEP-CTERM sorting domain-containing protein n=1 Tax=Alteromonas australica TaxID=589873 RepID=A0A075NYQ1_9ALTE|nr:hypothetical protein [Alteromonas australica]AIF98658.1 hypothetical protein EP13_08170 [Alteromonas australica]